MHKALENVTALIPESGIFYLAIYNKNTKCKLEGTSEFWLKVKSFYNKSNIVVKKIMEILYSAYYILGLLVNLKNPISYIKNYQTMRGMSFFTDIKDWLGGYPYEYASADEMKSFFEKHGLKCVKDKEVRSIGCNEFLFQRNL
jgi:hypothetical protein